MSSAISGDSGPRRMLARLRDVMGKDLSAEDKLNRVVAGIACDMVTEVCAVYVMRAGDVLELFATEGLKSAAIHQTRLRVGEGLIGTIAASARALALSDAQKHPNFVYRAETGEDVYHSFLGAPILRNGRVLGVLSVQNKARRTYNEEEVESLETVATVLAELVAGGELVDPDEVRQVDGIGMLPMRLEGLRLGPGIGIGVAVPHRHQFRVHQPVAEDTEAEIARLREAVMNLHGDIDQKLRDSDGEHRDILEAYRMIAEDAGWLVRIEEAVDAGLTAEAAVVRVQNDVRTRMSQVSDPYLRERRHDLDDLGNRLLQHLTGDFNALQEVPAEEDFILVARSMGPAELLDYDRKNLRGLVLEEGSPTTHVTIIARSLGIPVVGRARNCLDRIEAGDMTIVDADNGQVFIRPSDDIKDSYLEAVAARGRRVAAMAALRDRPAVTLDGTRVALSMNAGLIVDLEHLEATGADGVGLYRTEVTFMTRVDLPDVATQAAFYARVFEMAADRPVVFRTLDVGGDKVLPYWDLQEREENPAMGWRALRLSLDRPSLIRHQLRAMIRAAAGRQLCVMFPMVGEVAEFDAARRLVDLELRHEEATGGVLPTDLKVGAMLEVPMLFFQLPNLLQRVDFLSVGSNDMFQFLQAVDRGNARLVDRYDPLSPGGLTFFRQIVEACEAAQTPLTLCGEMAATPLDAMVLVGLGFRELSMAPTAIGPVKQMILSLAEKPLRSYLDELANTTHHSLREQLRAYARDHGVAI